MGYRRVFGILMLFAAVSLVFQPGISQADESIKIYEAGNVLKQIMASPETGSPPHLFRHAYGIAIVPGLIKVGLIVGGRYGTGVLSVNQGGKWSNPVFISLSGVSLGLQVGAESTDIVLIFKTARGVQAFKDGKFTLGGNVSVAAGPYGRHAEASTDLQLRAEIYSYSLSKGLFGGISIEGSALAADHEANSSFYGKPGILPDEIIAGQGNQPSTVSNFTNLLQTYTSWSGKAPSL